jgi:hypothetical protein
MKIEKLTHDNSGHTVTSAKRKEKESRCTRQKLYFCTSKASKLGRKLTCVKERRRILLGACPDDEHHLRQNQERHEPKDAVV